MVAALDRGEPRQLLQGSAVTTPADVVGQHTRLEIFLVVAALTVALVVTGNKLVAHFRVKRKFVGKQESPV